MWCVDDDEIATAQTPFFIRTKRVYVPVPFSEFATVLEKAKRTRAAIPIVICCLRLSFWRVCVGIRLSSLCPSCLQPRGRFSKDVCWGIIACMIYAGVLTQSHRFTHVNKGFWKTNHQILEHNIWRTCDDDTIFVVGACCVVSCVT